MAFTLSLRRAVALALLVFCAGGASAQQPLSPEAHHQQVHDANQAAKAAIERGPLDVRLAGQAILHLPAGYGFIPQKEGKALMEALGNTEGSDFLGLVVPLSNESWFAALEFEDSGYIKDDDAKTWDAGKLLDNLKKGTEAGNQHRAEVDMPPLEVTRWIEPPSYEPAGHRLVWSAEVREKNAAPDTPSGVNYNTYVLGREGYVSLNLVTDSGRIDSYKPEARTLLAAIDFNAGKRYGDFNGSTDRIAEYGLAALVGGVVAKKLGLLALVGLGFAKFAKLIAVAVAGAGAAFGKKFKRKQA